MTPADEVTPSINLIDGLIAAYVQSVEAGAVPDRRDLLDRHPDHAAALLAFFADFDRMDRVAFPLRQVGAEDATTAHDGTTAAPTTVRYFGDYELLEEVARGGMGIVYKARQTSLNRLVALKMVLTGTFAGPREVARFQAEAEAAANLDHPHIVPVFEVGEHDGQQYFSMKFVEGTSLAAYPRADDRAEVHGLIVVARAVHHAHQRGVLHRDLKPSNILVDPDGVRHVTDFGLAKRLGDLDRSLTDPGQIVGTARYMAPEQAAGRRNLTVAADTYALGVILYERLTGQTPFSSHHVLTLLRQVMEAPVPRPSTIRPGLDRDLESILLKCLDKDPSRRYPTAEDLAADLARWLEGRPITARPVTQAERFRRWCRRNPAIAGLTASVALALVLGTVISTLFAYGERKARIRAEKAEDTTERAFARSLIRPLTPEVAEDPSLSEPEAEALWELATEGTDSVRLRFLSEALTDALTLRQLTARSEPALIAALGLDPARQEVAAGTIRAHLKRPDLTTEEKFKLTFLFLEAGSLPGPEGAEIEQILTQALASDVPRPIRDGWVNRLFTRIDAFPTSSTIAIARSLADAIARETDANARASLSEALAALAPRVEPVESGRLCGQAARAIADAIAREADATARYRLAESLAALAPRVESGEAARLCGQAARAIADAIAREANGYARSSLADAFAALVPRVEPVEAARLCGQAARSLADAIAREANDYTRSRLAKALATLASRVEPVEAATIARSLADAIARAADARPVGITNVGMGEETWVGSSLVNALVTLAPRVEPGESARLCGQAARAIADAIAREADATARYRLAESLAALAPRVESGEAATIARSLADAIAREANDYTRSWLAKALATLVSRVEPVEAARLCGQAARAIADAIAREADARSTLADAFAELAPRVEPGEAATIARSLADAIAREADARPMRMMDQVMAAQTWVGSSLVDALAALAPRVEPVESGRLCGQAARAIADAIAREADATARYRLAESLAALAPRVESGEAARLCGQAARAIADAIAREANGYARSSLADAFAELAPRVEPGEAATIARSLADAIAREANDYTRSRLAYALAALAPRVEPDEAARLFGQVARAIADAIAREADDYTRSRLANALAALALRGESDEAARLFSQVARSLADAIAREADDPERSRLADALATLARQVDLADDLGDVALALCSSRSACKDYPETFTPIFQDIRPYGSRTEWEGRHVRLAASVLQFGLSGTPPATIGGAMKPSRCRLTTQELVDLLKMPTCLGAIRRAVLDQLEILHGRRFANHWEFVRFAQEGGLKLDFTSPPRRPDPKATRARRVDEPGTESLKSAQRP